jgi:hypothetical protein
MVRTGETTSEVTVLFKDAALLFALPRGATLADLAQRLAELDETRLGEPIMIDVKLCH